MDGYVNWQSWEDDPHDAWDGDGWWPDGGDQQWHEQWPEDDWGEWHEEPHGESTLAAVEEEDDQLKEAQQAEQAAEQLAMEAKRTWVEAQRTTQQMRKDRGFGQAGQGPKCFQCGGPHFVRDCPDRRHPPYSIGKGKGKSSYMADYSDQQLFFMKGKGKKGKGKSKHASMVSHDSFWTSKSKGKQRGKMIPPSRPAVNAYTMHYDLGGLELYEDMNNLSATMPEASAASTGMLDCGATASAAPDVAVRGLIQSILSHDKNARIDVQPYMRPFFRFGNGRWGQALYRVTIGSRASGELRQFSLFSLPNPEEMNPKNVVPVLIGMDHIGAHGCQMLVDFASGYVIDGVDPNPEIYQLNTNSKGHFVYDIIHHLTKGHTNTKGTAVVHICEQHEQQDLACGVLQFRPLEFYNAHVSMASHVNEADRRSLLWKLYQHVKSSSTSAASLAHMSSSATSPTSPDDISFRAHLQGHVAKPNGASDDSGRAGYGGLHQEPQAASGQEALATSGHLSSDPDGSSRSEGSKLLALLQPTRPRNVAEQHARNLVALRDLQLALGLYPKEGRSKQLDSGTQPRDDQAHVDRAGTADAGHSPNSSNLQGNDGQDHRRHSAGDLGAAGDQHACEEDSGEIQKCSKSASVIPCETGAHGLPDTSGNSVAARSVLFSKLGTSADGCQRPAESPDRPREGSAHEDSSRPPTGTGRTASGLRGREWSAAVMDDGASSQQSSTASVHYVQPSSLKSASKTSKTMTSASSTTKPLPNRVAHKVMHMVNLMTASLMTVALQINLEGRMGMWEIACSENSWLTSAANDHGINSRRINYAQGYDIYRDETWERLKQERRQDRPRKLWFSLPCTRWCQWTQVNYNTPEKKEVLESMRRRERRMLRKAKDFILDSLDDDPNINIYFEWTFPCSGWSQKPMVELEAELHHRGIPWEQCRMDGCNYGMMDKNETGYLHKRWMIKTTDELFWKNFRAKVCPKNHKHVLIQGLETSRSAYYPKRSGWSNPL